VKPRKPGSVRDLVEKRRLERLREKWKASEIARDKDEAARFNKQTATGTPDEFDGAASDEDALKPYS
jgi:hypothetical protein